MSIAEPNLIESAWRALAATHAAYSRPWAALAAMAQATLPAHLATMPLAASQEGPAGWAELKRYATVLGIDLPDLVPPQDDDNGDLDHEVTRVVMDEMPSGQRHVTWYCRHQVSNVRPCDQGCHGYLSGTPADTVQEIRQATLAAQRGKDHL